MHSSLLVWFCVIRIWLMYFRVFSFASLVKPRDSTFFVQRPQVSRDHVWLVYKRTKSCAVCESFKYERWLLIEGKFCSCYYKWLFCWDSWVAGGSKATIFTIFAGSVAPIWCQRCFNCSCWTWLRLLIIQVAAAISVHYLLKLKKYYHSF